MTKPNLNWAQRLLGVQHGLISGAAGKPHSIVHLTVTQRRHEQFPAEALPEQFQTAAPAEEQAVPELYRVRKFAVDKGISLWAAAVGDHAKKAGVKPEDLWVLFSCRGNDDVMQVATRVHDDIIAFRMTQKMPGSLHVYARMPDVLEAVIGQDVPQFSVLGDRMSFVSKGLRQEFPIVESLRNNIVKPATPPSTGYTEIRFLGTALSEALKWVADAQDFAGRGDIRVIPRLDGSNLADVYGLKPEAGYKRTVKAPGMKFVLVIPPLWIFEHHQLIGSHLGVRVAGRDYMWIMSTTGMVLGIRMKPEEPWCEGFEPYFQGLDGRVEFTADQVDAFRRALLQLTPLRFADKEPGIGVTPTGSGVRLRGLNKTLEVDGMGDEGPEVILDPDMLAVGLATTNVRFLEFDKHDLEQYVRLSGPDVRISLAPIGDETYVTPSTAE